MSDQSIDIFNGDADGIFSLLQWRKCFPVQRQTLITGVKRDHALVQRIATLAHSHFEPSGETAQLAIFDIPFDKNREALATALKQGYQAVYFDHHHCQPPLQHPNLTIYIETGADVCTGILVDKVLCGRQRLWALAAAYGDSLDEHANNLAAQGGLSSLQRQQIKRLGWLVNYNSYGADVADLHLPPADLYLQLTQYDDPFAVIADSDSVYHKLDEGFAADLTQAQSQTELALDANLASVFLGAAPWARRISGSYANLLSEQYPDKAIVVATENPDRRTWTVSVRAPQSQREGVNSLCSQFGGGGRAGAGGINLLEPDSFTDLLALVSNFYRK